ncbi:M56 family metallopeptidase [Gimesia aquarii]|uniref:Regulatory protein BlaR1 n=1 Tax=Gimesia aquarii TaxID=2527964 RepID=A0A517WQE0_9PLAN|nr:M56 family metallopeptidase [Gimesia aquarii]QDU07477.1 Regulatory protein BlaR1 [Gimesia aquarii]
MINDLISTDLVWRLGWTLLHSVWQILLIGLLVAVGLLLVRKSTTARYWISCCGLVLLYVPLVVTFALIAPPVSQESQVVLTVKQTSSDQPQQFVHKYASQSIPGNSTLRQYDHVSNNLSGSEPENESQITVQAFNVSTIFSWLSWLVGSWCIGVAVLAVWNGGGWIVVHKLRSHGTAPVDESLRLRMERLSRRLRVNRPVVLVKSMLVEVPMVIGWLRPMILMPASLLVNLSPDQLDAILAHELAHIRRHDYLVNLFQLLTESLLFYHPVTWILSRQIRIEREFCCDDAAIAACNDKSVLVQALAKVESSRPIPAHALSLFGRETSMSLQRARRIMGRSHNVPHTGIVGICALLFAVIVGFGVADSMRQAAATDNTGPAQVKIQRQASTLNQQVEQNPAPPAGKAGKFNPAEAGIDVKRFRIDIGYEGPSDKPFYDFSLSTYPFSEERNPMWLTHVVDQTNHAKLGQIVAWLTNSGCLLHAKKSSLIQAAGTQRYMMRVTSGDKTLIVNLGWDLGMLLRLDSLRKVLAEGDAQAKTPLDPLLNRLSGYRRQWTEGRVVNDIKTQLSASKKVFQAGKPIKVKLKVENTGDQTRKVGTILGDQGEIKSAVKQIEFKIFNRYGQRVPFLAGTSQFLEHQMSLEPGQAATFEFDLAKAHYLRQPGRYTAVYESWNQLDSNSFEFNVTPSPLHEEDLVGQLLPLLHDEWYMIANPNFKGKVRPGINFEEVDGFPMRLQNIPRHGNIGDMSTVWLWFTKEMASLEAQVPESRFPPSSQYLGKTGQWYFYAFADEKSLKRWPTVLEDVKQKLIKSQVNTRSHADSTKQAKQVRQTLIKPGDDIIVSEKSVRADVLDGTWWMLSTQLDSEAESFDQGEMNVSFHKEVFSVSNESNPSRSAKRRFQLLPDQRIDFFDERDGKPERALGRYQLAGDRLWIAVNDDTEEVNPIAPSEAVNLAIEKGVRYLVLQRKQSKVDTVAAKEPNKKNMRKNPGLIGHIYAVDRDGNNLELLADETLLDGYTFLGGSAWSHDEKWIACGATPYPGRGYSKSHLVKFCINGPDEGKKVDLGCGLSPSWSPDDKQISFLINGNNPIGAKAGLWVMDADGKNRRRLGYAVHGQWSPDGESILAVSSHMSPRKFLLFDVKTGKRKEILTNYSGISLPTWAPNKKQFAATVMDGNDRVLGIFDPVEAPESYTELWRNPWGGNDGKTWFDETWPDWSPDGTTIALTLNGSSIRLIDATKASAVKQLYVAPENTEVFFVAWSPDSKRLSFTLLGPGLLELEKDK